MCNTNRILDPARVFQNSQAAAIADPLDLTRTKWGDPTGRMRKMRDASDKAMEAEYFKQQRKAAAATALGNAAQAQTLGGG